MFLDQPSGLLCHGDVTMSSLASSEPPGQTHWQLTVCQAPRDRHAVCMRRSVFVMLCSVLGCRREVVATLVALPPLHHRRVLADLMHEGPS